LFASLFSVLSKGDNFSSGLAGLAISNALAMSTMLNYLVRMTAEFESNVTCIERIKEYFNIPQEAEWEKQETKPPVTWPSKGVIQFKNFYLRYRDDLDHALKDINCTINAEEKV
jgi:ATP-binding cassette subfamily C (CFTR/MRP) protein 1